MNNCESDTRNNCICTCRALKFSGMTSFLMAGDASSSINVSVNALTSNWKSFMILCSDAALWTMEWIFKLLKLNCHELTKYDGTTGLRLTLISPVGNNNSAHVMLVCDLTDLGWNGTVQRGRTHILTMARSQEHNDTTCTFKMEYLRTTTENVPWMLVRNFEWKIDVLSNVNVKMHTYENTVKKEHNRYFYFLKLVAYFDKTISWFILKWDGRRHHIGF